MVPSDRLLGLGGDAESDDGVIRLIPTSKLVRSIDVHPNGVVDVMVSLTTPGCPIRSHFETGVNEAIRSLDGVTGVNLSFDVLSDSEKQTLGRKLGRGTLLEGALAQVRNVICIGSGKGGVGKSSVTANLAAALAADGKSVGVLDADVWGYSQPRMLGAGAQRPKVSAERKLIPIEVHDGIKVMSIGFFVEQDAAVVWRGPMLHKALTQFLGSAATTLGTVTGADVAHALGGLVIAADQAVLIGEFADYVAAGLRASMNTGIAGWRDDDLAFVKDWGFSLGWPSGDAPPSATAAVMKRSSSARKRGSGTVLD